MNNKLTIHDQQTQAANLKVEAATVLLLCGGRGTRLSELNLPGPKPMVPILGEPFLKWQLAFFLKQGFSNFVLAAGFKGENIRSWADEIQTANVSIKVIIESEPLGTGGAIMNSLPHCNQSVFVANADSLLLFDIGKLQALTNKNEVILAGLDCNETERFGTVSVDQDGYITGFAEKRGAAGPINGGVYWFNKDWLQKKFSYQGYVSFEQQILPKLATDGQLKLYALGSVPFIDIGVPETYHKAAEFIERHWAFFQEDL